MSPWTHSVCFDCLEKLELQPVSVRMRDARYPEYCCSCGKRHRSGFYVRKAPLEMMCKGEHEERKSAA